MAKKQTLHPKILDFKKTEMPINYRNISVNTEGKLEERKNSAGEKLLAKRVVAGYGVIWGSINDRGEKFVKGSFSKAISDMGPDSKSPYKIKFRDEHGRACALMAVLKEDDIGLYFESAPLDDVQWCNDMLVQLKSGTINNFSIGFKHVWDKVEWDEDDDCLINLEARLYEISAVSIPSDIGTYAVRASEDKEYVEEDVEEFIESLPRSKQLEARQIFTRCMTLSNHEQTEERQKSLKRNKQSIKTRKSSIDYLGLAKDFKL